MKVLDFYKLFKQVVRTGNLNKIKSVIDVYDLPKLITHINQFASDILVKEKTIATNNCWTVFFKEIKTAKSLKDYQLAICYLENNRYKDYINENY